MGKLWRKGMAAFIAATIVSGALAGCGGSGNSGQKDTADNSQTSAGQESAAENAAGDSVIDFDAEPYEVVMEVLNLGQDYPDLEEIEDAINEIALKEINCALKIQPIHIADHATKLSLAAAGGDKYDLVYTGTTTSLSSLVNDGVLLPLDELAAERAPEYLEKAGDLIEAGKVNGQLYTLPAELYPAATTALIYNADLAAEFGIEMPETISSWADLEPIAQTLKDNGIYLMTAGDGSVGDILGTFDRISNFGGDYNYGVLMGDDTTEIINYYESQEFADFCKTMKDWRDKGYIPSDSLTSGENAQDVFSIGKSFLQQIKYTPGDAVTNQNKYSFASEYILTQDPSITTEWAIQYAWGICITSEQPERAMDMLNLIYTNGDVANLLMRGLEGKEYEKVSDHIIKMPDGVDSSNIGYSINFLRAGDTMQIYQWEPETEEFYDKLQEFNESAAKSSIFGYAFDASSVSTQLASVTNVVAEYRPSLLTGSVEDVDAAIGEFNEKLEGAGIQDIIDANQSQLDEWLAANQ